MCREMVRYSSLFRIFPFKCSGPEGKIDLIIWYYRSLLILYCVILADIFIIVTVITWVLRSVILSPSVHPLKVQTQLG